MNRLTFLNVLMTFLKLCACLTIEDCKEKFSQQFSNRNYDYFEGQQLYLLESPETGHEQLNHNFRSIASKLMFNVLNVRHFCNNSLIATAIVANIFTNVINLKVKNVYADTHLPETLMYVGYSNIYERNECNPVWYCSNPDKNTDKTVSINNAKETNQNCTVVNEQCILTNYITNKVVSKNLKNYEQLFALLEVLDENNNPMEKDYWSQYVTANQYKNKVVICADDYAERKSELPYTVVHEDCNLSDFSNSNILGIIAPKPMDLTSRLSVPSIFYDVPKILPEYEYEYPNSAIIHGNYYKHLTKAAIKLIELAKWIRIGIVSDISAYSVDFEMMLTSALHEKNLAYKVAQCCGATCDFREALEELQEARIIIVNVEEQYARALVRAAEDLGLNANRGYMWIWRDWPFKRQTKTVVMGGVYSLSIRASNYFYSIANSNIHKGFAAFENALKKSYINDLDIYMQDKSARYSEIMTKIKTELDKSKSESIVQLQNMTSMEVMYEFIITDNIVTKSEIYSPVTISDIPSTTNCAVRSNKFDQPCDDHNLLILMLVIFAFLIIIMLIHMFFTHLNVYKQRYNNF